MIQTRKPSHPGMFFKFTVLDDRGISITSAAGSLGVTRKALSEFVNGRSKCSHAMARRLSEATGTGVAIWINMQAKWDTWEAENMDLTELTGNPITPLALQA
ncbi:MAG: HigA family addiction module antitoxin [Colwellia sp.]|jgi:addiction module antidote protein, HigA family